MVKYDALGSFFNIILNNIPNEPLGILISLHLMREFLFILHGRKL